MSGINLHTLLGNVGKIETRFTADGKHVVSMSIATSEKWKDQSGQQQEKTDWNNVVVFGKPAEIISQYVNKGDKIYLQGKVVTRKYTDQSGQDKYITETVVDGFNGKFELLGSKQSSDTKPQQPNSGGYGNQQNQMPQQNQPAQNNVDPNGFDSDVPF